MMISFFKNILTPKKMSSTEMVPDTCNDQFQIDTVITTDPITDDDKSENIQTDVAKDSVSKSSESSNDASDSDCDTVVKGNLNPRVILTDCALKSKSNRFGSCVHKSNGYSSRRSQRKSAKVAAERISQIAEVCDTSLLVEVIRAPSQRICAKLAVRKIADIIDGSSESEEEEGVSDGSSESEKEKDVSEGNINK